MLRGELTTDILRVKGIGPATAEDLHNLSVYTVSDLLLFFPRTYEDRVQHVPLKTAFGQGQGAVVNTVVTVIAHDYFGWGRKETLKIYVEDETATAALVCFGRNFLKTKILPGERYFLFGKFEYRFGELQSSAFEVEPYSDRPSGFGKILPVYPLSGRLNQGIMRKCVQTVLTSRAKYLEQELPETIRVNRNLLSTQKAYHNIHFPRSEELLRAARKTLIFEELFYLQIIIGKNRQAKETYRRETRTFPSEMRDRLIAALPFSLTSDQEKALAEIDGDITSPKPMTRLLQGDVGCGKTLVGLLSALSFIASGIQAAFMAPTELLAKQHAENAFALLSPLKVNVGFLSGSVTGEKRRVLREQIARGEVDLIVGTHALFSEDIVFHNLGYIIIDEQHRFGVLQRRALLSKADNPDSLFMTATPIPRTLAITIFGDLDISTIKTMPANRKPIVTHLAQCGNEGKVYDRVRQELEQGRQAYFVYPLIEESENLSLKDAENMFHHLQRDIFSDFSLGLIHSRVEEMEKERVMSAFTAGSIHLLVATSVVEVGVDVPNATCMVIEHADRFGLSALHQLRGRVGRGEHQSYAFLIYSENLTDDGKQRLKVMMEHNDGFFIAEEDLKLRGAGNIAGTRQSGFFQLHIADPVAHLETMLEAKKEVEGILDQDPGLLEPEHRVIREVLTKAPPFPAEIIDQG